MLEVKFEYNIELEKQQLTVKMFTSVKRTLNVQPEEYDEGELIDIVSKVVVIKKINMSQRK